MSGSQGCCGKDFGGMSASLKEHIEKGDSSRDKVLSNFY